MNRRSFLKRAGAAALTVVAAPLFIPAERLEFGVPKPLAPPPAPTILHGPNEQVTQWVNAALKQMSVPADWHQHPTYGLPVRIVESRLLADHTLMIGSFDRHIFPVRGDGLHDLRIAQPMSGFDRVVLDREIAQRAREISAAFDRAVFGEART